MSVLFRNNHDRMIWNTEPFNVLLSQVYWRCLRLSTYRSCDVSSLHNVVWVMPALDGIFQAMPQTNTHKYLLPAPLTTAYILDGWFPCTIGQFEVLALWITCARLEDICCHWFVPWDMVATRRSCCRASVYQFAKALCTGYLNCIWRQNENFDRSNMEGITGVTTGTTRSEAQWICPLAAHHDRAGRHSWRVLMHPRHALNGLS
jgi:hypothetical protein